MKQALLLNLPARLRSTVLRVLLRNKPLRPNTLDHRLLIINLRNLVLVLLPAPKIPILMAAVVPVKHLPAVAMSRLTKRQLLTLATVSWLS